MASGGYHPARAWHWRFLQWIGLVVHIWGSGREANTLYLRRWNLTPRRLPYQLLLHTFYRGDEDPDPHDHPWDFWTFPLNRGGYLEYVMTSTGATEARWVYGWQWSHRPRNHTHRVLGPYGREFPFRTLVIRRQPSRLDGPWGFWVPFGSPVTSLCGRFLGTNPRNAYRVKVPWRTYILGEVQHEEMTS
jgi:hypothetical protein